ncbi:MAG: HAMP domain-containing sensor histidine kinase [Bdellovibrionia bacterium]
MESVSNGWYGNLWKRFSLNFGTILLICTLFLTIFYLLECALAPASLPSGSILCSFEVILSGLAAFKLAERIQTQAGSDIRLGLGLLSFFLGLLAVTDGAYMFLFYFLKLPRTATLAITLCTIPYSLAFLSCTFAIILLSRSGRDFYTNWKTSILPLALSVPVLIRLLKFLIPVLFTSYNENGVNLYLLAKILNTCSSFLLINTALAVLLHTRDKYWSLFSVGLVFIVLVNWALETQNLNGTPFTFGFFEFFWAAGIMLCMFSITLSKENSFDFMSQQEFSLISHYRHLILIIVSISLVVTHFLYPINVNAIRIVTCLTAMGCLAAVLMSQFLAEKIIALVSDFGITVEKPQKMWTSEPLSEFPVELRENLQSIIAARLSQEITLERKAERERQKIRQEANEKLNRLAAQFAHDIRSPIAALDTALGSLVAEPEDTSHLIRTVAARINDIANSLLKGDSLSHIQRHNVELISPHSLWETIEAVVREKRILFCANPTSSGQLKGESEIEIEFFGDPDSHIWIANFQAIEFKRVLSNLINNSFEALVDDRGKIHISLSKAKKTDKNSYKISISDNGTGIPEHIIPQLMHCGATFGKLGGTGLGLYHARQCIESWGGTIEVESTFGRGTTVVMTLPNT